MQESNLERDGPKEWRRRGRWTVEKKSLRILNRRRVGTVEDRNQEKGRVEGGRGCGG